MCTLSAVLSARAGDWPQILGPHRDGKADGEQLAAWPKAGPPLVWKMPVGSGFAGVAVVGNRAILFHRQGDMLVAQAVDKSTGEQQWKVTFPTNYKSSISSDDGPRCVPLVHQGQVYLLGPAGELKCVTLDAGREVWFRNVFQDFKAPDGYFGAGSSPIVEDGKLLLNVGGRGAGGSDGAGLVALSLTDGKTLWAKTSELASYSSPMAATIGGVRQVIFVTRLNVVSVDPKNGDVRYRFPFGARGPTVNAANPLVLDDHVFVSASYGVGAQWAKVGAKSAETVWESDDVMSSQYTTSIEHEGLMYGIDGRQDVGVARLRCFNPQSGKVVWSEEGFGTGNMLLAGGKLLAIKTDGELLLIDPKPDKFRPLARAHVLDSIVQALPSLSDGLLYVRDTTTLKCLRVGPAGK